MEPSITSREFQELQQFKVYKKMITGYLKKFDEFKGSKFDQLKIKSTVQSLNQSLMLAGVPAFFEERIFIEGAGLALDIDTYWDKDYAELMKNFGIVLKTK